ncbi:MAG: hypothetical protein JWQ91_2956 [Aeromicrobium sp.]|jgi:hypothetical protein|uniref:DUF5947 family protein n=1 Tax=Aeromicrobium sp. TaxID=1871063 RepID=UPI002621442B|nr:DUF5947 family protein [Aeromicrobium sp.]MCW2787962.1 hypothetical protein [Aeromicrobium sp.]MCW2826039.1 hypothetical protein [Aeromicrobium sp.]
MTTGGRSRVPMATLRRVRSARPATAPGERCEMCAEPIAEQHQHVVDLETRTLMCTCRGCYLLFSDHEAVLRYRAVPDRYVSFPGFVLDAAAWDDLQIPVGLVFVFRNSVQDKVVAFYPGPAGATESELPMTSWDRVMAANPALGQLRPDVEALLIYRSDRGRGDFRCLLVPIDVCYELVGTMRTTWRGFDGGQEARAAMDAFFARAEGRSRPSPAVAEADRDPS